MRANRKGQGLIEYSVLIVIVIAVFISMQSYVKRAFQGRWKTAVDDLGDQYDPRLVNSSITHTISANSETAITVTKDPGGYWTERTDRSHSTDRKFGQTSVGSQL